jgi:hypothetical protein
MQKMIWFICRRLALLALCAAPLSLLVGCERKWYLQIIESSDPAHPVLCLSMSSNCKGDGVDLAVLAVYELDRSGQTVKPVWIIQSTTNHPLKIVKYGSLPNGWKVVVPPQVIEIGKIYKIEDHVFGCKLHDQQVKCFSDDA